MRPETKPRKWGFWMRAPQIWAPQKMTEEVKRHQKRDMESFLTMRSDPTPGGNLLDWVFLKKG